MKISVRNGIFECAHGRYEQICRKSRYVVDNIYCVQCYTHLSPFISILGQHIFCRHSNDRPDPASQLSILCECGSSEGTLRQSRAIKGLSGRVKTCQGAHVSHLSYIGCHPGQLGTITVTIAMKVLCILSLVLAAVSATHVDLGPELDRMDIVPEER